MVYLEFVGFDGDEAVYDYMPERESAGRGTVSVDTKTRKRGLIKASPDDVASMYRGMAWGRIDQMLDTGELKEKTYSAWY